MGSFDGNVIFVTGVGSGIGAEVVTRLGAEGAKVACFDLVADGAEKAAAACNEAGGEAIAIAGDVSDPDSVGAAIATTLETFGRLDGLANVAGTGGHAHATDITLAQWNRMLSVNLTGPFLTCQAAIPHLIETKGAIVNVGSIAGLRGQAYAAHYCASKGGVVLLTKALAVEYATKGLRVNAVCPGGVDTPLIGAFAPPEDANMNLLMRNVSPMKRFAQPGEVADAIVYLLSDKASYVTGATLTVDGAVIG